MGNAAPDTNWQDSSYNESAWPKVRGGLGFGYSNLATTVTSATSLYIRKRFTVRGKEKIQAAILAADWDDAFVAYLNGFEIAREGIGKAWVEPDYNEFADYERKAELINNGPYTDFLIQKRQLDYALKNGENVIAIQIHNVSNVSTDLAGFFNLFFGIIDSSQHFAPAPKWFDDPPLFAEFSNLPIVKLTSGSLNDSLKQFGQMEIVWNGLDKQNSFDADGNDYNGEILLRYRGNSTLQFPKNHLQ